MKKFRNSIYKKIALLFMFINLCMINTNIAFASSIATSKAVTGTKNLITDVTKALIILSPLVAGILIGWQFFKLQNAEDDGETKMIKKRMKVILIGGIGVFIGSGLTTIILSYYQ